jgi:hypothetical protein
MLGKIVGLIAQKAQVVSVYNPRIETYTHYIVPEGVRLRTPKPPPGTPAFGEALENMLPSLPRASFRVGRSPVARGRVVVARGGPPAGSSMAALLVAGLDRLEEEGR